jgi:hypothetical protein
MKGHRLRAAFGGTVDTEYFVADPGVLDPPNVEYMPSVTSDSTAHDRIAISPDETNVVARNPAEWR